MFNHSFQDLTWSGSAYLENFTLQYFPPCSLCHTHSLIPSFTPALLPPSVLPDINLQQLKAAVQCSFLSALGLFWCPDCNIHPQGPNLSVLEAQGVNVTQLNDGEQEAIDKCSSLLPLGWKILNITWLLRVLSLHCSWQWPYQYHTLVLSFHISQFTLHTHLPGITPQAPHGESLPWTRFPEVT
jgi:hypothetical protein